MQHKEYCKSIHVINEKLMVIILATIKENGAQKQYDILMNLTIAINKEAVAIYDFGRGGKSSKAQKVLDIFKQ